VVCVVEDPNNIVGIEVTRQFNGLYHVLGGALSPLRGVGPEQLRIKSLVDRIAKGDLREIIVATNPTVEGEATAVYLSKLLKPLGMRVTRIAMGVPVGSDLEFADEGSRCGRRWKGGARSKTDCRKRVFCACSRARLGNCLGINGNSQSVTVRDR